MKCRSLISVMILVLVMGLGLAEAAGGSEKNATMRLTQIADGKEYETSVEVKIGDGNNMAIEMPGHEKIDVKFARKAGGVIKFAVTEIEMGRLRTMHFIGTGFQEGKLSGDIVFFEDGNVQGDMSGRFYLDDVFDW